MKPTICNHYRPISLYVLIVTSAAGLFIPVAAHSQQPKTTQPSKPPIAQAFIDVATHHSDIPGMGAMAGFATGGLGGGLSSLFGGAKGGGNSFGNTRLSFGPGKWLDISVMTRNEPNLAEATDNIPGGMNMMSALKLIVPPPEKYDPPVKRDDDPVEPKYEKPKGKMLLYWGCGDSIRPGQPKVFDAANANLDDLQKFFGNMRNSTTRGARSAPGNPAWPNKTDDRKVPENASLVGEHQFVGQGIPESFKVKLGDAQDFMPPYLIAQKNVDGVVRLEWPSVSNVRGYFISALGAKSGANKDETEMVIWTSSEVPELGFALGDYQTNVAIDKWIKEKAVLPATATQCAVPKGIFGGGDSSSGQSGAAMLRATAYGSEAFFAYPPRPSDVRITWEPQWQTKVRLKSTFMSMLGGMGDDGGNGQNKQAPKKEEKITPVDLLKGLFGR